MTKKDRKPYCKPQVKRVELVAGEAVLGGCKVSGTTQLASGMTTPNDCKNFVGGDCLVIQS
jgi:hypothetical protein